MKMLPRAVVLSLVAVSATAFVKAQFVDTFDTISPSWTTDRYAPNGFQSVPFGGDNRLLITISDADSAANRPPAFSGTFYNTQGKVRPGGLLAPVWTVSADLFVASSFAPTLGSTLVRTDLWTRDNAVEDFANYPILGITNAGLADPFNANAGDRSLRFRAWDGDTANGWVDLTVAGGITLNAWHNLSITSTGSAFEYRVDGSLLYTDSTYSDVGAEELQSIFLEAYNFGQAGSYGVYWDNLQAIPEPGTYAAIFGALVLGIVMFRRNRMRCTA